MRKSASETNANKPAVEKKEKLKGKPKNEAKKMTCFDPPSQSTSHTQFFKKNKYETSVYDRVTRDEFLGKSESISGSSDSYQCVHGPEGRAYTKKGLLKRYLTKELDPKPVDPNWTLECQPDTKARSTDILDKLMFLVTDVVASQQLGRVQDQIQEYARVSDQGFLINELDGICVVFDFMIENLRKTPFFKEHLESYLRILNKPIRLARTSDVVSYHEMLKSFFVYFGYLTMCLEDDAHFELATDAMIWQLSAADSVRGKGSVRRGQALAAAACMPQVVARMLAVTANHRFPKYMKIALLLVCESREYCMAMVKENIIENIFCRFNPYFPDRKLPVHDVTPYDPQDPNLKFGASSQCLSMAMSLLMVLLQTLKKYLEDNPKYRAALLIPNHYAQRCFTWAFRYEFRARNHSHERITMTVILATLVHCFQNRLTTISSLLMPDVLSLSVLSEVPVRSGWLATLVFSTSQSDAELKMHLIKLSVQLVKVYTENRFMLVSQHWLVGLMYLVDPGLCKLRAKWSAPLFSEIKILAIQAMLQVLPYLEPEFVLHVGIIRRILWYIEWYSEKPYELPVLYWCVRLLRAAEHERGSPGRRAAVKDLYDTHGVIILIQLCNTLLAQKVPPVEKSQAILGVCLRLLTSAVETRGRVRCCVYPSLAWPASVNLLSRKMLDVALKSLEQHGFVSERWLIALLNFIWEAIIWRQDYRYIMVRNNGIYKLLDLITLTRAPAQCLALAVLCDVVRAGDAVGQLVTWRAGFSASAAHPLVVKRGSTIAQLLAAIFKEDCLCNGVRLDPNGVIIDMEDPLMSSEARMELFSPEFSVGKHHRTMNCLAASEIAGSRLSKAFALLHLLSEDLAYKVSLLDETYNLYKNIKLTMEEEVILVLCCHYMTIKLNEVWSEASRQCPALDPEDGDALEEFVQLGRGWSKEIKRQQMEVMQKDKEKSEKEENSLYEFLARVRLNVALDALGEVRYVARSTDRDRLTHGLLVEAVHAHQRRSSMARDINASVIKTFEPDLDEQLMAGKYVKIFTNDLPKYKEIGPDSHSHE